MYDLVIHGGEVVDGTGGPVVHADVAVRDGRIVAVGPTIDRSGDYRKSQEYLSLRVQVWDLLRDEVLKARALEEA